MEGFSPKSESVERGRNVSTTITVLRHSQKASGHSIDPETGRLSQSTISDGGILRARSFGKALRQEGRDPKVVGSTHLVRSQQTATHILEGADASDQHVRDTVDFGFRDGPPYRASQYFFDTYGSIVEEQKKAIISAEYPQGANFDELTADEQEAIMASAEERAVEWYLGFKDKPIREDDTTTTPREFAAITAYQLKKFIDATPAYKSNTKHDYVVVTHQAISEPFLVYALLSDGEESIDEETLDPVAKLRSMGGSMMILDHWDLTIRTNDAGEVAVYCVFRNKEYKIDMHKVEELARIGETLLAESKSK